MTGIDLAQDEKINVYTVPQFAVNGETGVVGHGFFGRRGGVSRGVYQSFNLGRGSCDDLDAVERNFEILAGQMGLDPAYIVTVRQIHSADCVPVSAPWGVDARPEADAMVSDQHGIALAVLTADCAPVLFHGLKRDGTRVVGAAHAGWKGAFGGVLDNTVIAMKALGCELSTIRACVGPCIAQASYEVDHIFADNFIDADPANEHFFKAGQRAGHVLFDLPGYCAARLAQCGVSKVYIKDLDTYPNEKDFFSYRRSTHRADDDYGRQISLIYIKG